MKSIKIMNTTMHSINKFKGGFLGEERLILGDLSYIFALVLSYVYAQLRL
jgi:hypothetical protein